jgi:hypothetical protein
MAGRVVRSGMLVGSDGCRIADDGEEGESMVCAIATARSFVESWLVEATPLFCCLGRFNSRRSDIDDGHQGSQLGEARTMLERGWERPKGFN